MHQDQITVLLMIMIFITIMISAVGLDFISERRRAKMLSVPLTAAGLPQ
jgi:hypothetical protein